MAVPDSDQYQCRERSDEEHPVEQWIDMLAKLSNNPEPSGKIAVQQVARSCADYAQKGEREQP
jgi:hypothetical protein